MKTRGRLGADPCHLKPEATQDPSDARHSDQARPETSRRRTRGAELRALYRFSIRRPRVTLVLGFLITATLAPGAAWLRLRTDGHALVPSEAPEIHLDETVRAEFGVEDPIVLLIESTHDNGIYNVDTLRLVDQLTAEARTLPAVREENVVSLATEYNDRVWPGTLKFRRFLEPFPTTENDFQQLRKDLHEIGLYRGVVIAEDDKSAAVMIGVPQGANRVAMYSSVGALVDRIDAGADRIRIIGAPVAEALLGTHIMEDLGVPEQLLGTAMRETNVHAGFPRSWFELRDWIARHIGLLPIAITLMACVFLISFRSLTAVALPMLEVACCLVAIFGLMGYCDVPIYLTIAPLPVILTVTGVTDEIHVFTRYTEFLHQRRTASPTEPANAVAALLDAMDEMYRPVLGTALTTAVGCLSYVFSPLAAVRAFGLFAGIGVLFCMFWTLTVIPASLALLSPERFVGRTGGVGERLSRRADLFAAIGRRIVRWRWAALIASLAVVAALPTGIGKVFVQDSWIDGFAPDSEFHRATTAFNDQFLGTHILHIRYDTGVQAPLVGVLDAPRIKMLNVRFPETLPIEPEKLVGQWIRLHKVGDEGVVIPATETTPERRFETKFESQIETAVRDAGGEIIVTVVPRSGPPQAALRLSPQDSVEYEIRTRPLLSPAVLGDIESLETFIKQHREEAVGGVLGPAAYLSTMNFMTRARKPEFRALPAESERIDWLWAQYDSVRGKPRRLQVVNEAYSSALITVYMKNANFIGTRRLMEAIRAYEAEHLTPRGIALTFAGDVAVSQTLIDAIVTTQIRSVSGSVLGVLLVVALVDRSFWWGLLTVLPCALGVLANFAVMGYLGVPLGVASSMFTGMTVGIGVDYAIHLLARFRLNRSRGETVESSLADAFAITGPAVTTDALGVAIGFGVLTLSLVPANARLGGLVVLSLVNCLAATFLLLPALLRFFHTDRPAENA